MAPCTARPGPEVSHGANAAASESTSATNSLSQNPIEAAELSHSDAHSQLNATSTHSTNPRLAALQKRKTALTSQLEALEAEYTSLVNEVKLPSGESMPSEWTSEQKSVQALTTSRALVKDHIDMLHRYNEIKDIGLGLMGLVADQRGVRQVVIMEEYGVTTKD